MILKRCLTPPIIGLQIITCSCHWNIIEAIENYETAHKLSKVPKTLSCLMIDITRRDFFGTVRISMVLSDARTATNLCCVFTKIFRKSFRVYYHFLAAWYRRKLQFSMNIVQENKTLKGLFMQGNIPADMIALSKDGCMRTALQSLERIGIQCARVSPFIRNLVTL